MELDLAQLRAFSATVDEGTFDAAARRLHVTPSAISQRIKALENATGRVLLQRTKPVTVTESGQVVLRLARQIEALTTDADARLDLGDATLERSKVSIAVNADSLATWVMPALAEVAGSVTFEIFREDEERTVELLREGKVMAAITSDPQPAQGCTSIRLGRNRYRPMASPEFIATWFPDGPTAAALAAAPVVMFDRADDLQDRYLRRRARRPLDPPRNYVPSSWEFTEAVRYGFGWGLVPDLQIGDHERSGGLVQFDRQEVVDVVLYWQQWKLSSTALERVTSVIRAHAKAQLP